MSPQRGRAFANRKFDQGLKKLIICEYDGALRYFLWAIKECPGVEDFYVKRSECFLIIGDFIRALSDAHEALKLNPESVDVKARITDCITYLENDVRELMEKKRFDDCLEIIEKAQRISPDNVIFDILYIKIQAEQNYLADAHIINKLNLVMEIASSAKDISRFSQEELKSVDNNNNAEPIVIENGEIHYYFSYLFCFQLWH